MSRKGCGLWLWHYLDFSLTFWFPIQDYLAAVYNKHTKMSHTVVTKIQTFSGAGLSGSVGYAVRLETRRLRVQPPPMSATFFRGDWSWNIFYGHSLPSADSRRAVVSFWRKNVHNTGWPLRGLSLPSKRVLGKLTALDMTPLGWLGRKTSTQTNRLSVYMVLKWLCFLAMFKSYIFKV